MYTSSISNYGNGEWYKSQFINYFLYIPRSAVWFVGEMIKSSSVKYRIFLQNSAVDAFYCVISSPK